MMPPPSSEQLLSIPEGFLSGESLKQSGEEGAGARGPRLGLPPPAVPAALLLCMLPACLPVDCVPSPLTPSPLRPLPLPSPRLWPHWPEAQEEREPAEPHQLHAHLGRPDVRLSAPAAPRARAPSWLPAQIYPSGPGAPCARAAAALYPLANLPPHTKDQTHTLLLYSSLLLTSCSPRGPADPAPRPGRGGRPPRPSRQPILCANSTPSQACAAAARERGSPAPAPPSSWPTLWPLGGRRASPLHQDDLPPTTTREYKHEPFIFFLWPFIFGARPVRIPGPPSVSLPLPKV